MAAEPRIRAVIVDDEPLAREGIALSLAEDPDIEVIAECGNGHDAVQTIADHLPDLVFLDIQMPGMNGFEVVAELDPATAPAIVFVTAYDEYALRAFEVHALDYLLKPFDDDRFEEMLARVKEHIRLRRVSSLGNRLIELLESYQEDKRAETERRFLARLAIKASGRVVIVDVDDIDWIEAADYYVQLHTEGKAYLHRQTMASLEAQLDPQRFARIHRSAIVNLSRVRELRHHGRREMIAVLSGGIELRVARSHRDKLQKLLA